MKHKLIKWLYQALGGQVRLIKMTEEVEREILEEMSHIERILDYWELQKQAGYQLYGKTSDKKYLGVVELSTTMIALIQEQLKKQPEEERSFGGYESEV